MPENNYDGLTFNREDTIHEVRSLTSYHDGLISDDEIRTLYQIALDDVSGMIRQDAREVENPAAGRAIFWSLCLFCKIHMGEIDGLDFNIGSIQIHQMPIRDITRVWYRQLDQYINVLRSESAVGMTNVNRSDRQYGDSTGPDVF